MRDRRIDILHENGCLGVELFGLADGHDSDRLDEDFRVVLFGHALLSGLEAREVDEGVVLVAVLLLVEWVRDVRDFVVVEEGVEHVG